MTTTNRLWRVTITSTGAVERVELADSLVVPDGGLQLVVWALTAKDARDQCRSMYNGYCAAKLRERRAAYNAEGKCACGRVRDSELKRCRVCREGIARCRKPKPLDHVRDEKARVATQQVRIRDRRVEIRTEVLLEVRDAFYSADVQNFGQWLQSEIEKLTGRKAA
jgi:hypothetical protein